MTEEMYRTPRKDKKNHKKRSFLRDLKKYRMYFLMLLPGLIYFLVFCYGPMFGVIIAFKNYRISKGFWGSEWVGLQNFIKFFSSPSFWPLIRNTFLLNFYSLLWGFPIPIVFAIMLSETQNLHFRKAVQTMSFLSYFVSIVITVGIVNMLLSTNGGILNRILNMLIGGNTTIDFLVEPQYFRTIYVAISIWRGFGWTAIIYLAAIIGIDRQLYEAAILDGASTLQRIFSITVPMILPTIVIMLIMNVGSLLGSAFDLVYLLSRPLNADVSEVIATYVYKRGIAVTGTYPDFSYSTAIGLFQSIINVALLTAANLVSKKATGHGLY